MKADVLENGNLRLVPESELEGRALKDWGALKTVEFEASMKDGKLLCLIGEQVKEDNPGLVPAPPVPMDPVEVAQPFAAPPAPPVEAVAPIPESVASAAPVSDWITAPVRATTKDYTKSERMAIVNQLDQKGVAYKKGCGSHTLHKLLVESGVQISQAPAAPVPAAVPPLAPPVPAPTPESVAPPAPAAPNPPAMSIQEVVDFAQRQVIALGKFMANGDQEAIGVIQGIVQQYGAVDPADNKPKVKFLKPGQHMPFVETLRQTLENYKRAAEAAGSLE